MIQVTDTIGYVLKRMDYKESSKIVFLYTASGKTSFLVHGANKLSSPYLAKTEVLTKLKVTTVGKGLKICKDIEILDLFPKIKNDLEKYTYCLHILEILQQISDAEIDHEKLFAFLGKIFPLIEIEKEYVPYIYMFESKLLYLLGIQPELQACVVCKRKEVLAFSVKDGGTCCLDHLPLGKTYPRSIIDQFQKIYYYNLDKQSELTLDELAIREIRMLLDEYYQYHLNFETKSRQVLKGLIGY